MDPRVPSEYQAGNYLYANNRLDHVLLARRADFTRELKSEAHQANKHSFYFTNITPQLDEFNQSGQAGFWGRLENALYDVDFDGLRCRLSVPNPVASASHR
ncbi:DNA/RNA non-specific endonuclease [Glutamicibacter soli]